MATQLQPPPVDVLILGADGKIVEAWRKFFTDLNAFATGLQATIDTIPGVLVFTLATQPALGVADAGALGFISDYNHFLRWTGTLWTFAEGDVGNGFFRDFAVVPQEAGWKLCDGSATDYLVVGATLTVTAITPPNLSGSPSYRKSGAAYTGAVVGAAAPGATMAGATATGTTGTGTTGTGTTGGDIDTFTQVVAAGIPPDVATSPHTHSVPGLSIPGLSIPALGVGTLAATVDATADPQHVVTLPYFRR